MLGTPSLAAQTWHVMLPACKSATCICALSQQHARDTLRLVSLIFSSCDTAVRLSGESVERRRDGDELRLCGDPFLCSGEAVTNIACKKDLDISQVKHACRVTYSICSTSQERCY